MLKKIIAKTIFVLFVVVFTSIPTGASVPMDVCTALCEVIYEACVSICADSDDEEDGGDRENCIKECQLEKGRCELECEI